ncbi:MAG: methionine--tRNA ligase [Nanoarchaeota archaeon]
MPAKKGSSTAVKKQSSVSRSPRANKKSPKEVGKPSSSKEGSASPLTRQGFPAASSPIKGHKRILVTAALPYVNNIPHLGNIVPTFSADAYARFLRLIEEDVIFVCGTDEHGTTTETKALEEGLTPRQVCDKYFAIHKGIYDFFQCQFDCFGRTSSKENRVITLDIFRKLEENGFISEQSMDQAFCGVCKRFLADRFVGGACPSCGYGEARGDQCENCGRLLDPAELKNPVCKICKKTTPEILKTNHLFIDLPKLDSPLRDWMQTVKPRWTVNAVTMTDAWLKEGLKARCITRDLQWGIPVPIKGFGGKVFYSWFDAPIGYIGITAETRKDWKEWWQSPSDVRLVQFMGKDNIPFHTILFPAFLIGTKEPWTLVSDLSVNEFLNLEGGLQFSKSRGVGVFGDNAMSSGIPADVWRYYILVNRPEKSDTEFSWKDLQSKINDELVGNFGNLVNRTLTFLTRYYGGVVDKIKLEPEDEKFIHEIESHEENVKILMQEIRLKDALKEVMHISKLSNQYFQQAEPWKTIKERPLRASTTLGVLVNVVKDLSIMMHPFMPGACSRIRHQLNLCADHLCWKHLGLKDLGEGHKINGPEILFSKVDDATIKSLSDKFGFGKKEFPADLRVARILDVKPHPDAEKLYVIQLDVGSLGKRQIVAGIRKHYSEDELKGKHIVIVANLQPAKLRGIESQGMLLAGCEKDDKKVRVVEAPKSSPGDVATFGGVQAKSSQILYDEFAKIPLEVIKGQVVQEHQGIPLCTGREPVSCDVADHAKVR